MVHPVLTCLRLAYYVAMLRPCFGHSRTMQYGFAVSCIAGGEHEVESRLRIVDFLPAFFCPFISWPGRVCLRFAFFDLICQVASCALGRLPFVPTSNLLSAGPLQSTALRFNLLRCCTPRSEHWLCVQEMTVDCFEHDCRLRLPANLARSGCLPVATPQSKPFAVDRSSIRILFLLHLLVRTHVHTKDKASGADRVRHTASSCEAKKRTG